MFYEKLCHLDIAQPRSHFQWQCLTLRIQVLAYNLVFRIDLSVVIIKNYLRGGVDIGTLLQ